MCFQKSGVQVGELSGREPPSTRAGTKRSGALAQNKWTGKKVLSISPGQGPWHRTNGQARKFSPYLPVFGRSKLEASLSLDSRTLTNDPPGSQVPALGLTPVFQLLRFSGLD